MMRLGWCDGLDGGKYTRNIKCVPQVSCIKQLCSAPLLIKLV